MFVASCACILTLLLATLQIWPLMKWLKCDVGESCIRFIPPDLGL
jgi:hypothetical protein